MSTVKGSKQFQVAVIRYRPWRWAALATGLVLVLVIGVWSSYLLGEHRGFKQREETQQRLDQANVRLENLDQQIQLLQQQNTNLTMAQQIDRQSMESTRQEIANLHEQIDSQDEELAFYKRIMFPDTPGDGLRIESLDMNHASPGRVNYTLRLSGEDEKRKFVEGQVLLSVLGVNGDSAESEQPIAEVDPKIQATMDFKFRYFQDIQGEMLIPDEFEPKQIVVTARAKDAKVDPVEKSFEWLLDGS